MRRRTGKEVVPYQDHQPSPSPVREIGRQLGWLVVRVIANTAQSKPQPPPRQKARREREVEIIESRGGCASDWPLWLKILAAAGVIAVGISAANHSANKYREHPSTEDWAK